MTTGRARTEEEIAEELVSAWWPARRDMLVRDVAAALRAARLGDAAEPIERLIDRGSLGTPEAKRLRGQAPKELVDSMLALADGRCPAHVTERDGSSGVHFECSLALGHDGNHYAYLNHDLGTRRPVRIWSHRVRP